MSGVFFLRRLLSTDYFQLTTFNKKLIIQSVSPAEAGVQKIAASRRFLDSGLRRNDCDGAGM